MLETPEPGEAEDEEELVEGLEEGEEKGTADEFAHQAQQGSQAAQDAILAAFESIDWKQYVGVLAEAIATGDYSDAVKILNKLKIDPALFEVETYVDPTIESDEQFIADQSQSSLNPASVVPPVPSSGQDYIPAPGEHYGDAKHQFYALAAEGNQGALTDIFHALSSMGTSTDYPAAFMATVVNDFATLDYLLRENGVDIVNYFKV
jgi:hypothetical protein